MQLQLSDTKCHRKSIENELEIESEDSGSERESELDEESSNDEYLKSVLKRTREEAGYKIDDFRAYVLFE